MARDEMEAKVRERTAELLETNAQLQAEIAERKRAEQALEDLAGRLIHAQEQERSRIGRELHDHISQTLGVLTIKIDQLRANGEITPGIGGALDELRRDTSEITDDVHRLSHRLHSSTLDYLGLVPALQKLVSEFSERHDIPIAFAHASMPAPLPSEVALCLFRVAEESLTNIAKHSQRPFGAGFTSAGAPDGIHLTVEDAGAGFDVTSLESKAGLGFVSMQERLRVLHGTIHVDSAPSRGTRIDAWVPPLIADRCAQRGSTSIGDRVSRRRRPFGFPSANSAMKRPRILLADDHKLMAEALQHLLQADFDVVGTVSDGRALIKAAAELKPELVVVDIGMPLLNGLDAADQLKALHPDIKVIFLTQNREPRYAVEAFRRKASGYLLKDSAASELTTAIREALQGRSYVSPLIAKGMLDSCLEPGAGRPEPAGAEPTGAGGAAAAGGRQVDEGSRCGPRHQPADGRIPQVSGDGAARRQDQRGARPVRHQARPHCSLNPARPIELTCSPGGHRGEVAQCPTAARHRARAPTDR